MYGMKWSKTQVRFGFRIPEKILGLYLIRYGVVLMQINAVLLKEP